MTIAVFLEVFKTFCAICVGSLGSYVFPYRHNSLCLVGSNYGGRSDPNADQVIEALRIKGAKVHVVANNKPNTLQRGSFKVAYYFFSSKACLYTHSLSDIIPHAHKFHFLKPLLRFPRLVFLQHGVIGLKSTMSNGVLLQNYIKSLEPTFDYMVVSSMKELALIEDFGVPSAKIKVTGLPRFDRYHNAQKVEKTVLIFFTWQRSDELSNKIEKIQSSGIVNKLGENGYTVKSTLHDMQNKDFTAPSLNNAELQHTIATCSLLITDDSSMAWDILYRKQEVIFLSPSNDWLSKAEFLLDRCCYSSGELRNRVDELLKNRNASNDFHFADAYDNNNTKRVLELLVSHD